ncbi:unnamed protein product [Medioppia subpectinata]|uniref:DUF19 domain-containing protein n=1 Tax=Medioppia subpectinata TaxID=1979941 RepID=A0A7R9KSU7_9ACAR|nr:unnamed protein product [Medioppia subpectinata]CAG2109084.1 unnamed protein product [Medioppia subpectinata]
MKLAKILLLLIVCTLYVVNGQTNSTSKACKTVVLDTCLMNLLLIGDPKYVFPVSMPQMDTQCRTIRGYEKCIKDYSSKCLKAFPKQVTSVLAYGVAKTNKGYCSNKKRKESFIMIGECANKMKSPMDKCMFQYIDRLQGAENYRNVKMRLPMACCEYYKMKQCILGHIEREGKPLCTDSVYNEAERLIDGYAFDVLQLICGDYTEDSDKCQNSVPKTPKKLSSQKRTKSLLLPLINILAADEQ